MGQERWLPVLDWEGLYAVSDWGRIKSVERIIMRSNGAPQTVRERILKPRTIGSIERRGYAGPLLVQLFRAGVGATRLVHHLVLEAFIGPRPPGLNGLHNDTNSQNNRLDNLRWGTQSEAMHDLVLNGKHHHANKTHCKRDHEFTPENTGEASSSGGRACLTCMHDRQQDWYQTNRDQILEQAHEKYRARSPIVRHVRGRSAEEKRQRRAATREARRDRTRAAQRAPSAKAKARAHLDKLDAAIPADNTGLPWTPEEDIEVQRGDITIVEIACRLRRTRSAVKDRRLTLRRQIAAFRKRGGRAELTAGDVRKIRESTAVQQKIAAEFSISQSMVSGIRSRRYWAHVI